MFEIEGCSRYWDIKDWAFPVKIVVIPRGYANISGKNVDFQGG